jgi:hypothetical protein
MNARRLVSKIQHLTGSRKRGRRQSGFDRALIARAMREGRRQHRHWTDVNASLTCLNPAWRAGHRREIEITEPHLDRYRDPQHPGYRFPVATKHPSR